MTVIEEEETKILSQNESAVVQDRERVPPIKPVSPTNDVKETLIDEEELAEQVMPLSSRQVLH